MDNVEIIRHPPLRIPHSASPYEELWCIGDVHGRVDLLAAVLQAIDETPRIDPPRVVVQTGDLIDRGPASLACIDLCIEHDVRALLGNHEQLALLATHTREIRWHREGYYDVWTAQGGGAVLREGWGEDWSYRAHPSLIPTAFGVERWDYVRTASVSYRSGDVVLVHAGVDPARPLHAALYCPWDDVAPTSPVWIRGEFLHRWGERDRDVFVVHGHTPPDNLRRACDECAGGRLNLDLGSWSTGGVRAARIVGDVVEIVDAWGEPLHAAAADAMRRGRT